MLSTRPPRPHKRARLARRPAFAVLEHIIHAMERTRQLEALLVPASLWALARVSRGIRAVVAPHLKQHLLPACEERDEFRATAEVALMLTGDLNDPQPQVDRYVCFGTWLRRNARTRFSVNKGLLSALAYGNCLMEEWLEECPSVVLREIVLPAWLLGMEIRFRAVLEATGDDTWQDKGGTVATLFTPAQTAVDFSLIEPQLQAGLRLLRRRMESSPVHRLHSWVGSVIVQYNIRSIAILVCDILKSWLWVDRRHAHHTLETLLGRTKLAPRHFVLAHDYMWFIANHEPRVDTWPVILRRWFGDDRFAAICLASALQLIDVKSDRDGEEVVLEVPDGLLYGLWVTRRLRMVVQLLTACPLALHQLMESIRHFEWWSTAQMFWPRGLATILTESPAACNELVTRGHDLFPRTHTLSNLVLPKHGCSAADWQDVLAALRVFLGHHHGPLEADIIEHLPLARQKQVAAIVTEGPAPRPPRPLTCRFAAPNLLRVTQGWWTPGATAAANAAALRELVQWLAVATGSSIDAIVPCDDIARLLVGATTCTSMSQTWQAFQLALPELWARAKNNMCRMVGWRMPSRKMPCLLRWLLSQQLSNKRPSRHMLSTCQRETMVLCGASCASAEEWQTVIVDSKVFDSVLCAEVDTQRTTLRQRVLWCKQEAAALPCRCGAVCVASILAT